MDHVKFPVCYSYHSVLVEYASSCQVQSSHGPLHVERYSDKLRRKLSSNNVNYKRTHSDVRRFKQAKTFILVSLHLQRQTHTCL